jgi:hypothetical protein
MFRAVRREEDEKVDEGVAGLSPVDFLDRFDLRFGVATSSVDAELVETPDGPCSDISISDRFPVPFRPPGCDAGCCSG